ncbi:MAG: hypothetical protein H6647_06760 [Anaerolineales bacterium]|nr:hypothetical protein [Anaerolineales bacterium]
MLQAPSRRSTIGSLGYVLTPRLLELIGDGTVDATADLLPFIVVNNLAFQPSADIPSPADLPGQIGGVGAPRFIMLGLSDDPAYDPFWPARQARLICCDRTG